MDLALNDLSSSATTQIAKLAQSFATDAHAERTVVHGVRVDIEYCTRSTFHTHHRPEQYDLYYRSVRDAFLKRFPWALVVGNSPEVKPPARRPVSHPGCQRPRLLGMRRFVPVEEALRPRLGAFEVTVSSEHTGSLVVFSKLASRRWPNPQAIVQKTEYLLHDESGASVDDLQQVSSACLPRELPPVNGVRVRRQRLRHPRCPRSWPVREPLPPSRVKDLRALSTWFAAREGAAAKAELYSVIWHEGHGHIEGEHFETLQEAKKRFHDLEGGPHAIILVDAQFHELFYYGLRGSLLDGFKEWWQQQQAPCRALPALESTDTPSEYREASRGEPSPEPIVTTPSDRGANSSVGVSRESCGGLSGLSQPSEYREAGPWYSPPISRSSMPVRDGEPLGAARVGTQATEFTAGQGQPTPKDVASPERSREDDYGFESDEASQEASRAFAMAENGFRAEEAKAADDYAFEDDALYGESLATAQKELEDYLREAEALAQEQSSGMQMPEPQLPHDSGYCNYDETADFFDPESSSTEEESQHEEFSDFEASREAEGALEEDRRRGSAASIDLVGNGGYDDDFDVEANSQTLEQEDSSIQTRSLTTRDEFDGVHLGLDHDYEDDYAVGEERDGLIYNSSIEFQDGPTSVLQRQSSGQRSSDSIESLE